ncbi:MAG TPA: hypothetical protein PLQ93_02205 [Bacteroidia bacterium]|nr:hypothetical protein [Bacteroidia bacterium]
MKRFVILTLAALISTPFMSREKAASEKRSGNSFSSMASGKVMASCAAPKASKELWVNNVRTIVYSGGDMWWDLNGNGNAYYYVPAVSNRNVGACSCFGGSIWLGGLDAGGQLKVAAMTYRQNGIDFWPGPLDTTNASADQAECLKYDQIYTITRLEVDNFVNGTAPTSNIMNWPGNGDVSKRQGRRLAPYVDVNADGFYDPTSGDYPAYDVQNRAEKDNLGFCKTKLYGDLTLFWVFNDNGGIHTETQGVPIGVEVRAQAFGFKTNDEINNMTFYSYEVINRSSFQLGSTYFTVWNDPDLGYYLDDYVGCDVSRGLGYIYNADPFDETLFGTNGYGDFPPALGCDFFKGPLADPNDGIDNDFDSGRPPRYPGELTGIDEPGETIQMSRFTYYNNNIGAFPSQTTNPDIAIHYYNYMTGFWKDGSPFTFGGNAYGGTQPATFVYDGNPVTNTGWTEKASGNLPGDRRFLQSAGPFTLKPGAVNDITFGMPWAQSPTKGGNIASLELLYNADDKAQALFDNCFKLLDGPEAPDMTIQELGNELIFYLTNQKGKSNNYKQFNNDYKEEDISIISDPTSPIPGLSNPDKNYYFEGYIVYQVVGDNVSSTDLDDRTKAIPVFQCDLKNNVSRIVNYEVDNSIGALVPKVKVEGANKGISSTFRITNDAFSTTENRKLINNKTYYFLAVAYAWNEYLPYVQDVSPSTNPEGNFLGQKRPYLEGRKFKRASGIPHMTENEKDGTVMQSVYGFGPKITRVEGQGNGGNILSLTRESENAIVANNFVEQITYQNAQGPLNIKVVDPLNVKSSEFKFRFIHNVVNKATPEIGSSPTASNNAMIRSTGTAAVTYTGTIATLNADNCSWELIDLGTNRRYHPNDPTPSTNTASANFKDTLFQSIRVGNEYFFQDLGFSVKITQVADPGEDVNKFTDFVSLTSEYKGPAEGSYIGASISYENGASNWLNPIPDVDGENPLNWILSGSSKTAGFEDAYYSKSGTDVAAFYDPAKQYGNILNKTWAPYPLCASYYSVFPSSGGNPARIFCGPGFNGKAWAQDTKLTKDYASQNTSSSPSQDGNTDLRKLSSVLVVYTKDKSKWTRCAVLEMQEKSQLSVGNAIFFSARNQASVDKQGKAYGSPGCNTAEAALTSTTGMGWFPGYAINIETGERLNMAFGEDSYQKENNGDDMVWNPTSNVHYPYPFAFGGKHFVYVFAGNTVESKFYQNPTPIFDWENEFVGQPYGVGSYDEGKRIIFTLLNYFTTEVKSKPSGMNGNGLAPFNALERDIMWVSMPIVKSNFEFEAKDPANMPSDVRMQINVSKPYRYGFNGIANIAGNQPYSSLNKLISVNNPSLLTTHIKTGAENNNFPLYTFNTSDIATLYNQSTTLENALDQIRVVPNPYYGSSAYEVNRTDNKVRITNLPNKCTVRIFSMNGTLIRTIKRDVSGQEDLYIAGTDNNRKSKRVPYEEWDLKNQNNISVASGLYIFHIDAPGIGEKIVKWFGVMRPLDVTSY